MSKRPRFALRTIRNGAVTIRGVVFRPDEHHLAYDGRLDNQRFAFGLYWGPENFNNYGADGWNRVVVCLWGSEAAYRATSDEEHAALWPGPNCIDGVFAWEWWHAVAANLNDGCGTKMTGEPTHDHAR
jgi:hypothetical protein